MSVVYSNFCGMVVSETRNGVDSDYVCDTLGSTIGLLNSAGTMTDRWEYWPYGEVISHAGSSVTPLTFLGVIGYFQDIASKLSYVRARHLRLDLARWLTADQLWPQQLPFAYAENNPATVADPSGKVPCSLSVCPGVAALCVVAALAVFGACLEALVSGLTWLGPVLWKGCLALSEVFPLFLACVVALAILFVILYVAGAVACSTVFIASAVACYKSYCACCHFLHLQAFGCDHHFTFP